MRTRSGKRLWVRSVRLDDAQEAALGALRRRLGLTDAGVLRQALDELADRRLCGAESGSKAVAVSI